LQGIMLAPCREVSTKCRWANNCGRQQAERFVDPFLIGLIELR
jgi:hypothetical protein